MINILMSRSSALVEEWSKDELIKILKPNMRVVVLGFSFFGNLNENDYFLMYGKDSEYFTKISANFSEYNISDVNWIYYYQTKHNEALDLINNADILYLPGGAPDLMFERIKEKELLDALKNFKGIVIGSSAGAMIQLEKYHISPDNEYFKFSEHEGLGYINEFFIEVHYNRRIKQKSSMRKMRKKYLKPIYTIPDDGMVIVKDSKIITLNQAKKYYNKKGINKKEQ